MGFERTPGQVIDPKRNQDEMYIVIRYKIIKCPIGYTPC